VLFATDFERDRLIHETWPFVVSVARDE